RPVLTEDTTEPSVGFRSDWILPGTDYRVNIARGLLDWQLRADHGAPNLYGFDPIQFYVEGYFPTVANGLSITVGRFYAPFGIEYSEAVSNQLISYSYVSVGGAATHTGTLSTLKLTPEWTLLAGLVAGSDVFIGPAAQPTFTGGLTWAPKEGPDSFTAGVIL